MNSIPSRGLTKAEAAAYCGLAIAGFDAWVARRIVPGPMRGTRRWDRHALDQALDNRSGLRQSSRSDAPPEAQTLSAFERWKAADDARAVEGHS